MGFERRSCVAACETLPMTILWKWSPAGEVAGKLLLRWDTFSEAAA